MLLAPSSPIAWPWRSSRLAGVAVVVFVLLRVVPGDPIAMMISPGASPADIAALRAHYGLDAPLLTQFWIWIVGVVHRRFRHLDHAAPLRDRSSGSRLPATLELAIAALVVAVVLGGSARHCRHADAAHRRRDHRSTA